MSSDLSDTVKVPIVDVLRGTVTVGPNEDRCDECYKALNGKVVLGNYGARFCSEEHKFRYTEV